MIASKTKAKTKKFMATPVALTHSHSQISKQSYEIVSIRKNQWNGIENKEKAMSSIKVEFQFTVDNAQLALDEIEHQIKNIGLSAKNMKIIDSAPVEKTEKDWFDDYLFTIEAIVYSDEYDSDKIKELIENGSFENYEFID